MEEVAAQSVLGSGLGLEKLVGLFGNLGALAALLWYFVQRDRSQDTQAKAREGRMEGRINDLETYQKDTLTGLVEKTTVAVTESTEAAKHVCRVIEKCEGKQD